MGLKYLLDTNILSEPVKPSPDVNVMQKLADHAGEYCTCVTVWHELHYGIERMPESARKSRLGDYLASLEAAGLRVLPYEKESGVWLAQERARLSKSGMTVSFADGEVAAVAACHGFTLVTRNTKGFSMFKGLCINNWFNSEGCSE